MKAFADALDHSGVLWCLRICVGCQICILVAFKLANCCTGCQIQLRIQNRRGEFCLTAKLDLITGAVSGHRDGFGFVIRDGGGDDVYLSAREMRPLFDGDRVAIKIIGKDRRGKPEGNLVEVLERGVREVAGQFIRERGIGLVIPDNSRISHRILIAKGESG